MNLDLTVDAPTLRGRLHRRVEDLPTLPSSTRRLLALDADAVDHFDRSLEILESDPVLSIRVLSLANSAASSPTTTIDSVRTALARLGGATVNRLVLTAAISGSLGRTGEDAVPLWHHAVLVGGTARRLHPYLRDDADTSSDEAYTVGLLHDIGHFVMLFEAPEAIDILHELDWSSPEGLLQQERHMFGTDHAALGVEACQRWGLPDRIAEVVSVHHDPVGSVEDPAVARLQELVQFADHVMFPWIRELDVDSDIGYLDYIVDEMSANVPDSLDLTADDLVEVARSAATEARRLVEAMGLL